MSHPPSPAPVTARVLPLAVGRVNPRLFGSFVEHLGRCVYTGIYEPGHPLAGPDGLRRDVLALVRELGVTTVRYPGGNFVSGYRWEDGVGPRERRPRRLDPAWHSTETNQFGLSEFAAFTRAAGVEPMMAVNLGTRGISEALDLWEYCNHPGGTRLSDLRRAHGDEQPYDIRMWCLGNEMDGPWQLGAMTADEYGRLATRTALALRMFDPDLTLVACGSSGTGMPTFGQWESTVLQHAYDVVDHISCHAYYFEQDDDVASFLASAQDMEQFIDSVVATADAVKARRGSRKTIDISFDEWNVWYQNRPWPVEGWPEAPHQLEDVYTVTDAVVVGSLLITLLRHCDRVTAASLAQLVNVIAPIMTEPGGSAWRQTIFHPFAAAARLGRGQVLALDVDGPTVSTARFGDVPSLHATAVRDDEGGLTVFAVNRHPDEPLDLHLTLDLPADEDRPGGPGGPATHVVLADADRFAVNTAAHPNRVTPRPWTPPEPTASGYRIGLPALSWNVVRVPPPPGPQGS